MSALPASRKRVGDDARDDDISTETSSKRRNVEGRAVVPVGGVGHSSSAPPSLVLHVRSLPTFTTEAELIAVLQPHGGVERAFITQHNHQAFVQMVSLAAAEAVVAHSASPPGFALRGRQIFLQYSNRKEVVPPPNQNVTMHAALRGSAGVTSGDGVSHPADGGSPNRILLVSVSNLRVPVTLDHIHQICKPSGTVHKIITFTKGAVFKSLVEFGSVESASHAKSHLHGKQIFEGCCDVTVGFSSQQELKITAQGPKARDFQAELAAGGGETAAQTGAATTTAQQQQQQVAQAHLASHAAVGAYPPMGGYGAYGGYGAPTGAPGAPMNPMSLGMNPYAMQMANPYAHMAPQMGFPGMPYPAGMTGTHAPVGGATPAVATSAGVYTTGGASSGGGPGSVLIVSGLPITPDITPESLFTLFGVYGDVQRVKILYAKRHTAMIQFTSAAGCSQAIQHLHHAQLMEKQLSVSISRHETISMPKSTTDTTGAEDPSSLTQDFTGSKLHRYRQKPVNTKNLHSPAQILHVGNIADGATEEELAQVFGPSAVVQFFIRDPHMAYVKLPSVSDAILTLMRTHNHRLNGRALRVSFSGKDVASFDAQQQQQQSGHATTHTTTTTTTAALHGHASVAPADETNVRVRRGDDDGEMNEDSYEGVKTDDLI